MARLVIDEASWEAATPLRREEWRTLTTDLLRLGTPFGALLASEDDDVVLRPDPTGFHFIVGGNGGQTFTIGRGDLSRLIDEYIAVIRRLSDDSLQESQIEALDMAKKVVHDDAARRIGSLVPELSSDVELLRRTFSLLVALAIDTTRLERAHRHR
jgi:hypothetical protein